MEFGQVTAAGAATDWSPLQTSGLMKTTVQLNTKDTPGCSGRGATKGAASKDASACALLEHELGLREEIGARRAPLVLVRPQSRGSRCCEFGRARYGASRSLQASRLPEAICPAECRLHALC
jgi:hypothetical protein